VFSSSRATLHFVPSSHRQAWGKVLASELYRVAHDNNLEAWTRLFMLPKCVLPVPKRGGARNRGDRQTVSDLCQAWKNGDIKWLWTRSGHTVTIARASELDKKRVHSAAISHTRQGRLGKACSLLSSSGVAPNNDATRQLLRDKHPERAPPDFLDMPDTPALQLAADFDLLSMLRSFSKDVGTDGTNFRVQHLLDANEAQLASPFLPLLRNVINLLLSGKAALEAQLFVAGARLTALKKAGTDIRPIAAGNVFRRLASKCVCSVLQTKIRVKFGALQVGVACRGGAEQIVHTMREKLEHWDDPDFSVLKVDFSNAFNSISRRHLLEQCRDQFPEIFPWVQWCYGAQPYLFYDEHLTLRSCVGVQQGDPLGPMLFCLVLHLLVLDIHTSCPALQFHKWYLDDGSMAGRTSDILRALTTIRRNGPDLGLHLNLAKCELFSKHEANLSATFHDPDLGKLVFPVALQQRSTTPNFTLLGSPFGDADFCADFVSKLRQSNAKLLSSLTELGDPQVSLHLLRTCASFCRFVHLARTTPPHLIRGPLQACDEDIRDCFSQFAAVELTESAWDQVQLSVNMTGLGLRSVSRHCAPAFISSHVRAMPDVMTFSLHQACDLFADQLNLQPDDNFFTDFLVDKPSQHSLSHKLDHNKVLDMALSSSTADKIRLSALQGDRAGAWLQALPSRGPIDLTLSPNEMQAALKHRLGLSLANSGEKCAACNIGLLDILGHHHLTCPNGGFVVARHNRIRDTLFTLSQMAGLSPEKEQGAFHHDRSRPADILIPHLLAGKSAACDITVVSPLISDNIREAGVNGVLSKAVAKKHSENDAKCLALGWTCLPLAVDSYGQWCEEAHTLFSQIAMRLSVQTKVKFSAALSSIHNSLGIVLARQNALSILSKRSPVQSAGAREVYQLASFADRS